MSVGHEVRRLLWKTGLDLVRFDPASHLLARRRRLLATYGIDTVFDVGANAGQFAQQLRRDLGFRGRIVSFEPLRAAFKALEQKAARDPAWDVHRWALGDKAETREINVAGNSWSSSLLDMLPAHVRSAPESRYVGRETIEVKALDGIFADVCGDARNAYLKIDTQGFERQVLDGASRSLPRIDTVQLEMSLVPLYAGETLFPDMTAYLAERGYVLVSLEGGFADPKTGELLQVDGIFHRPESAKR